MLGVPWWLFLVVYLAASLVWGIWKAESEGRQRQRDQWAHLVGVADRKLRDNGYVLRKVEVEPGFLNGRGYARWENPNGNVAVMDAQDLSPLWEKSK